MRILSGFCCFLMLVFAGVQFNDPDVLSWVAIYGIVAIWCGVAAFRPAFITQQSVRVLLTASLALAAIGTVWYFPKTAGFWHTEVWWVTETAREGMGMMIAFAALLVAWLTCRFYGAKVL